MKVVILNQEGDPAGVGYLLYQALNKIGVECRHLIPQDNMMHKVTHGVDLIVKNSPQESLKAITEADILHINGGWTDYLLPLTSIMKEKPFVLHNHGGWRLLNVLTIEQELESCFPANKIVVCSPLSLKLMPKAIWLPSPIPLEQPEFQLVERDFNGEILICHKTFSEEAELWKGSKVYGEIINDYLRDKWAFPVKLDFFHDLHINEVLKATAPYHICIDNLTQGFIGIAGWESLAKGQAVIARLDPTVERIYNQFGKNCPIINVSGMDEMANTIRELMQDREKLKRICTESAQWMRKYYTEERIAKMWKRMYEEVLDVQETQIRKG